MPAAPRDLLRRDLLEWFARHRRDLPWRRTRDPYAIWISEVMLQQTQVATVIPYWHRFLERFPTVRALASAELPDVFALWRGLGYYARARNLHKAAQEVVTRHGGVLPGTVEALLELPGFGRYTAGAVASIAFGQKAPLVDGNVARVFSRLFEVEGHPGERVREAKLWALAEELVQCDQPGELNQALMELGATVCRFESPTCLLCPVRAHCGAHRNGRVDELPPPRVRAARKTLRLAVACCAREGRFLLGRRAEGGLFGGLWELPSVEVAARASQRSVREALERLTDGKAGAHLGTVSRTLTHRDLELEVYRVELASRARPSLGPSFQEHRWVSAEEAQTLGMGTAMVKAFALALDARPGELSKPRRRRQAVSPAEPAHPPGRGSPRRRGTTDRPRPT